MGKKSSHQYVERGTSRFKDESFFGDQAVQFIYSRLREQSPILFNALISPHLSGWLAHFIYDNPLGSRMTGARRLFSTMNIDFSECLDAPGMLTTVRKLFERKIRYWESRPMSEMTRIIVSPSDSRVLMGSFCETSQLFLKDKFFSLAELVGNNNILYQTLFKDGDFAIFRLTPEKYHYNHTPVAGRVLDFFEIQGDCHSCHPVAVVTMATPFSKNKRVVTIIDTDVEGGTQAGLVAMIEVVALLIGDIVQCYSEDRYENPLKITRGMFLKKGRPKSLYRPSSSTNVLIFQKGRVVFCRDLIANMKNQEAYSLFSKGFGQSLVETEIQVRSPIAVAVDKTMIAERHDDVC